MDGEGEVKCRSLSVTSGLIPDYVFEPNYNLPTLQEVDNYIKKNKHLPSVISAAQAKEKGSVDIGEFQIQLLKKIEELTLYLIDLSKKYETLKAQIQK